MPHFYGAVGAPNVGHHQWRPRSRRPLVKGSGRFNRSARLFLHEIRWRDPPSEYAVRITAVVVAILVHVVMLLLMVMMRPPGYPPPAGTPEVASIDVRLISKSKPPPPPPPIKLPKRKHPVKKATRQVPPSVKRAPVAAMPPVPQVTPAKPEIKVTPANPTVVKVPTQTQPVQQAAASPEVSEPAPQVELSPAPPKVVLEKSAMAVAPPPVGAVQVAPAEVPSSSLQAVPTERVSPVVKLGNPTLDVAQQGQLQGVTQPSIRAEASTPQVPDTDMAPVVHIAATPTPKPSIEVPATTPHALSAPAAQLAPIPQAPQPATATPALDLPLAQVPEPQAPAAVQAPSVQAQTSSVQSRTSSATAAVASASAQASPAGKARSPASASTSWTAAANDQFKPVSGKHGESASSTGGKPGQKQGYVQLLPHGNSNVMSRSSDHLGYKSTIFDKYWAPDNENILDTFLRRVIDKLSFKHTFHVAPGVRVHCVVGPLAIFVGCGGDPPRPESSKSNDPRLNMAPARSLVPDLPAPASTAAPIQLDNSAKCATARVAGSLPPPGCPGAPVAPSQSDQWHPSGG